MKKSFKKILSYFPPVFLDYFEMIFSSAAENHLRFVNSDRKKFRSYTQLKRQQKRIRTIVLIFLLAIVSAFLGVVLGPLFFPQPIDPEIYIPNGKADIVLGNVSKNQMTVIFKTLDSANGNKPLATKASVEVYEDPQYLKLARRTNEDDFAVTHIIPVDSLQEGVTYYVRIIATDASIPEHSKTVSSWGTDNEPIKAFTAGDLVANCNQNNLTASNTNNSKPAENTNSQIEGNLNVNQVIKNDKLEISGVINESHLQPQNKVQAIISWNTSLPATTSLIYGENSTGEKVEIPANDKLLTKHQVVLTTLNAGTTYYFKVRSIDNKNNVVMSEEYSLRTPRPQENTLQRIADNFKAIFRQVKPK